MHPRHHEPIPRRAAAFRAGRRLLLALGACLYAGTVGACGGREPSVDSAAKRPTVVCTVGMVTDIVRNVAGDRVEVVGLLGEGVDPHLYKPTRSDIERLMSADMVFYSGLLLEGKMTDALVRVASAGRRVHAVTELLDESFLLEPPQFAGHADPHVWMDPVAWKSAVEVVRDRLVEFDPPGRDSYEANASAYRNELDKLDAYCEVAIASIPPQQRVLVTAHDAFNYFGRRYGIEVHGIQGISTESEAGVQDIERLVELIVERGIPAVFIESTVSQRNIEALVAGARARGRSIAIGASLFSDAMGPPGTYEGTYVGMIDHNATAIARALGGVVPERGMNGRLAP
ncbi:MAG: zinc ABC transporter substrate-binding protein [Phycisphaerales bacterium]|nr:zinc ABC transporter substrate-binding protein [Phycisphaerales bacterium]